LWCPSCGRSMPSWPPIRVRTTQSCSRLPPKGSLIPHTVHQVVARRSRNR
jgi:hypothetical protein